jgi:TolB-like protein
MKVVDEGAHYRFEGFILDLARGALVTASGQDVALRRKSFELLRVLVENEGRLLDHDTIIQSVWSDVIVTDGSIAQCVREIRRALGDDRKRIIKTVPRRGYVFAAKVTIASNQLSNQVAPPPITFPGQPSIAILPFQNLSGDPEQDYFADGVVEDITTALSRTGWLFVIARNSSFAYKGKSPDIRTVGRELGVRYVLEGGLRKSASRIRISCQLIEATLAATSGPTASMAKCKRSSHCRTSLRKQSSARSSQA